MGSENNLTEGGALAIQGSVNGSWLLGDGVQCPGLTLAAREVHKLAEKIPRRLVALGSLVLLSLFCLSVLPPLQKTVTTDSQKD